MSIDGGITDTVWPHVMGAKIPFSIFCFEWYGDHRDLHVLPHSFPTRSSSALQWLWIFAQPVDVARLSSVFGRRRHPVYGTVRMHTGVDFAAARGTPVRATARGRIAFIGWRSGYGRVVEIAHDAETTTRYAHLSAVPGDLAEGGRVAARSEEHTSELQSLMRNSYAV